MVSQAEEMYVGAIYRLRNKPDHPVSLRQLKDVFNFSPISIHEMVQKLDEQGLVVYLPYKGVILTEQGEEIASALVRRHRIWEIFLTDSLGLSPEKVHSIADQLEHAAPEEVTEKLIRFMGNPEACPHGSLIPPARRIRI